LVLERDTVVCRVFLAADELLGMEELSIRTCPDLIEDRGFEVDIDRSRNVLSISWDQQ
jgi:hypothetical protein